MAQKPEPFMIAPSITIKQAMKKMSELGEKELYIADDHQKLIGVVSDGDIRRWILKEGSLEAGVLDVCNKDPKFVKKGFQIEDVKELMLKLKIESVPIINEKRKILEILIWDDVFSNKVSHFREKLNVPVLIMAGGKGTRLDPFTKILPKPLIPIGDKPIIEIIMDKFCEYDIKDFYLSVNHKAKMIKSYFEEMNDKYRIRYIEEDKPLGTAGSLKLIEPLITGTVLVTNCDVIIDCDYAELMEFHSQNQNDLTLVGCMRHFVIPYGICEIESGGNLKSLREKPEFDFLAITGMYVINKNILKLIPDNQPFDMTELIDKARKSNFKIGVFPIKQNAWIDVGQWEEYNKTLKALRIE